MSVDGLLVSQFSHTDKPQISRITLQGNFFHDEKSLKKFFVRNFLEKKKSTKFSKKYFLIFFFYIGRVSKWAFWEALKKISIFLF